MKEGEIHPPVRAGQPLPGPGGEMLRWARNISPPGLDNPPEIMRKNKKCKGARYRKFLGRQQINAIIRQALSAMRISL
jgi:hypothetical protein